MSRHFDYIEWHAGHELFCEAPARKEAAVPRPFCVPGGPSLYAHVQSTYWGVGFLKFYQLKQAPNFLLAAPIITLAVLAVTHYVRAQPAVSATLGGILPAALLPWTEKKRKPERTGYFSSHVFVFVAQLAAMLAFGTLFMHIQVRIPMLRLRFCPVSLCPSSTRRTEHGQLLTMAPQPLVLRRHEVACDHPAVAHALLTLVRWHRQQCRQNKAESVLLATPISSAMAVKPTKVMRGTTYSAPRTHATCVRWSALGQIMRNESTIDKSALCRC